MTLTTGERATEKLAVDAQILIRSLLPGSRTHELFSQLKKKTTLVTTPGKIGEIKRWLPSIGRKRGLDVDLLLDGISALPVEVVAEGLFKSKLSMAHEQIGKRDPTDVDLLALALAQAIPIWSDDQDFDDSSANVFTTEEIVAYLEEQEGEKGE